MQQYAERVFGINQGSVEQRIDAAIEQTVQFFKQMQMLTCLADAGLNAADLPAIIDALERHRQTALGEQGDITLKQSKAILEAALV